MDMKVKDFDSYEVPNRKPWIILLLLLLVGSLVYFFFFRDHDESDTAVADNPEVVTTQEDPSSDSNSESSAPVVSEKVSAPVPVTPPTGDVAAIMKTAEQLVAEDRLVDARMKYLAALKVADNPSVKSQIEQKLAPINIQLVLSPRQMPEKTQYLVKSGNSLARIARKFGTTVDLIQKNNLLRNPNRINVGDRLTVFTGKFELKCSKSRHDLVVTMNGDFFKRYLVGTGRFGKTPAGTFVIREKIKEPPWWRPDGTVVPFGNKEENILGTRWFSLKATGDTEDVRGYGIHGTWSPESVGTASSAGCLRMKNEEVEELFVYIPVGTKLTIVE